MHAHTPYTRFRNASPTKNLNVPIYMYLYIYNTCTYIIQLLQKYVTKEKSEPSEFCDTSSGQICSTNESTKIEMKKNEESVEFLLETLHVTQSDDKVATVFKGQRNKSCVANEFADESNTKSTITRASNKHRRPREKTEKTNKGGNSKFTDASVNKQNTDLAHVVTVYNYFSKIQ